MNNKLCIIYAVWNVLLMIITYLLYTYGKGEFHSESNNHHWTSKNLIGSLVLSPSPLLGSTGVSDSSVLVADLWSVSFLVGLVFHDLQSAVGQEDSVRALSTFVLATFLLAKFAPTVCVLNFVRELVVSWFLFHRQTQIFDLIFTLVLISSDTRHAVTPYSY